MRLLDWILQRSEELKKEGEKYLAEKNSIGDAVTTAKMMELNHMLEQILLLDIKEI